MKHDAWCEEKKKECLVPPAKQPLGWRLTLAARKFFVVPKRRARSQTIKLDPLNHLVSC